MAEINTTEKVTVPEIDLSCEQALLGTLLSVPDLIGQLTDLRPEHFVYPLHSRLFADMQACSLRGETCSPIVLISRFGKDVDLAGIGASNYIAGLLSNAQAPKGAFYLKEQIRDDATRRALIEASKIISESATHMAPGETSHDVVRFALDKINEVAAEAGETKRKTRHTLQSAIEDVTTRANDYAVHGVVPSDLVSTGSKTLDDAIGGWRRGRFYVVAGRPGMGKTTVAVSWLLQAARKNAKSVFFSLEMGAEEIGERALSDICLYYGTRVEYQWIARNDLRPQQLEALFHAKHEISGLSLSIYDRAGITLGQLRALVIQEQQRLSAGGHRLDIVCVDHIGLMKAADRYSGNKVAETDELSAGLKTLAKDLDVAVIALSQLNRQVEARDNKRPLMSDLKWSGAIEQDADVIMLCYRPEYYLLQQRCDDGVAELERLSALEGARNKLEIQIAKQRGGATPTLDFMIDAGCAAVRDK